MKPILAVFLLLVSYLTSLDVPVTPYVYSQNIIMLHGVINGDYGTLSIVLTGVSQFIPEEEPPMLKILISSRIE